MFSRSEDQVDQERSTGHCTLDCGHHLPCEWPIKLYGDPLATGPRRLVEGQKANYTQLHISSRSFFSDSANYTPFCFDCCWCQEIRSHKRSRGRWKIALKADPALMPQPDMSNVGRLIINQHSGTVAQPVAPKMWGRPPLGEIRKARGWYWWSCMRRPNSS